jgi:hypothetical protein
MAEDSQKEAATIPPYLPWPTFTAFIEKLNKTAIPNRIDSTLIKNLSGTVQSQLLNALKFLGLTNGNGAVTEKLKALVKTYGTPQWGETLGESFIDSYNELIGSIDLDTATPGELKERFREVGGIEGDTIEKAMRFYLNALKDAGISYSPHLKIRQRAPRGVGQRRKSRAATAAAGSGGEGEGLGGEGYEPPKGTFEIPLNIIGQEGSVFLPEDITVERWKQINQYVEMVIGLRPRRDLDAE